MADFFNTTYYNNTVSQWLISLSLIVVFFVFGKTVYWIFNRWLKSLTGKTKTNLDDIIIDMVEEPLVVIITLMGFRYSLTFLKLSEGAISWSNKLFHFVIAVIVAWLIARLYDALHKQYLVKLAEKTDTDLDDQLLPILKSGVKFIVISLGIVIGLNNAGYDVTTILAGLGIGGLAFALAAQDTVSNLFGGIIIFMQRPFKTGDRIRVGGVEGYVREVGLRSSLLETIAGEKIMLPNKVFSSDSVINLDIADYYFQLETYHLHRHTTIEQIEQFIRDLKEITNKNEHILWADPVLAKVSDYSFDIELPCGINPWNPDQPFAHYLHKMAIVKSEMNFLALKLLKENGIKLALPVLLHKDYSPNSEDSIFAGE